jgi:hypothetical protein
LAELGNLGEKEERQSQVAHLLKNRAAVESYLKNGDKGTEREVRIQTYW